MSWKSGSIVSSLLVACVALALPSAAAAEYPDKPIRLIVPQAPAARPTRWRASSPPSSGRSSARTSSSRTGRAARCTIGLDLVAKSRARRLHARHGADRRARHHPPHGGEAALQHRARLPADRAGDARASAARGVAEIGIPLGEGPDRRRQGQSRQAHQCLVEQRLARPCRRRAVQVHDRHEDRARALSRRRRRDQRPDRRARRISCSRASTRSRRTPNPARCGRSR